MSTLSAITDPLEIANVFAADTSAEENRGVIGYDHSPEVLAKAAALTKKMQLEFNARLSARMASW